MKDNEQISLYNKRVWLNDLTTPSTGSVVCYHGRCKYPEDAEPYENMFIAVSDCNCTARLHKTQFETKLQFINKLKDLRAELTDFINYLEDN